MISVIIPSAGATSSGGKAFLMGALLSATNGADEVAVVVTDRRISDAAAPLLVPGNRVDVVVDVEGPFNFSRAVNAGATATHGDWLVLLNDDVTTRPRSRDWLKTLARKRADIKGVGLVSPDGWHTEHAGIHFGGVGGLPRHRGWGQPADVQYPDGPELAVTAAAMMIRRSVFEDLGGFDEDFPINYNDVDFCLRAYKRGYRTVVYNTIRLNHREGSSREVFDPIPDFRRLIERHGDFLTALGIRTDPDAATHHLTHIGLLQATA